MVVERCNFLLCTYLISSFAVAQITETDTLKWGVQVHASGNLAFGNVERILLSNSAEILHSLPNRNWVFKSTHQYRYGEVNNRKIDNNYIGNGYIYFKPFKKLYPFYLAFYETNFRVKIKSRLQNGLGITWVPLKKVDKLIKISTSLIYDVSKYNGMVVLDNTVQTKFKILRPTFRFYGEYLIENSLKINYEFIDQISMSKEGNQRILAFVGLGYSINQSISLQTKLNYSHEDITTIDVKKDDWLITYGVSFTLSK